MSDHIIRIVSAGRKQQFYCGYGCVLNLYSPRDIVREHEIKVANARYMLRLELKVVA